MRDTPTPLSPEQHTAGLAAPHVRPEFHIKLITHKFVGMSYGENYLLPIYGITVYYRG